MRKNAAEMIYDEVIFWGKPAQFTDWRIGGQMETAYRTALLRRLLQAGFITKEEYHALVQ